MRKCTGVRKMRSWSGTDASVCPERGRRMRRRRRRRRRDL